MKCDIIIPVWNQLAFTKDCIESIAKNTGGDYRIVVVDNASDYETRTYLEGLRSSGELPLVLMRNEDNLGFVKAVNQGMAFSDADFVCLLNNDTVVASGWLEEMIAVANSSDGIGLVNPSSNNLGQRPEHGEPVERYAAKLVSEKGKYVELGAAIGFCMLIKRGVINKIGLMDEIYGMGNFEDTDYSRKAVQAGYLCVRSRGAYVYHRESSSFGKVRTFNEDFNRNREIFEFRWGKPVRVAYILDRFDAGTMKRLEIESLKLARSGNWVTIFVKNGVQLPKHSNIMVVSRGSGDFYVYALYKILTKKKRFGEIYVGSELLGNIIEALSFIHKAKVRYY